jgi:pyruvate/2-oxoglutarate dehydrogenase complex dihydrolipoamide dehydrogenase (E3) component
MAELEHFDVLVLGSGQGGQLIAWHLAQAGRRTALVERRWIGGSCPNIACMPSKTEIWSARVAHLARHGERFGVVTGAVIADMETVVRRKRDMVRREVQLHLQNFEATGTQLIGGDTRFVAPKTLEVRLNQGGKRLLAADQVFLNLGTHAAIPELRGLEAASPLTHIEALELDYAPRHLITLGAAMSGSSWRKPFAASAAA